jgi:antitoxin YefM
VSGVIALTLTDRRVGRHDRGMTKHPPRPARDASSEVDQAELETLAVLGDPQALADIREADAAHARGDVIRGGGAVRDL